MTNVTEEVRAFFDDFEQASTDRAWERYEDLFLAAFLTLDPSTAAQITRDALIAFLPHRKAIFDKAGAIGSTLAGLEVEELDQRHVLARTAWRVLFEDDDHDAVVLHSTFLLRREDRWRVAVYLNHGNLLELLGLTEPAP